jgi:hypothetical protein
MMRRRQGVAIAALVLWMCTAAVGGYLLATSIRPRPAGLRQQERDAAPEPDDSADSAVPVEAIRPAGAASEAAQPAPVALDRAISAPQPASATARPVRAKERFDPPSLAHAKSEPLPGMRALAEFTHPALAMIGFGFWFGYVASHDRVFAAIGFGILLGAICAGLSWFTANIRAAKRAPADQRPGPLSVTPRLLILHGAGALLTLLIVALITTRA